MAQRTARNTAGVKTEASENASQSEGALVVCDMTF